MTFSAGLFVATFTQAVEDCCFRVVQFLVDRDGSLCGSTILQGICCDVIPVQVTSGWLRISLAGKQTHAATCKTWWEPGTCCWNQRKGLWQWQKGLCLHKNTTPCGFFTALGLSSVHFSSVSPFNMNLWWLSCSSFMAVLDLMLSSFHFHVLDTTLLCSTGEYMKCQGLKDLSQQLVSDTVVIALEKVIGNGENISEFLSTRLETA